MNEYVKVFVFTCLIFFTIYDVICLSQFQNAPVPFKSGGDASVSFISSETGPPKQNINPAQPSRGGLRDFMAPQKPNIQTSSLSNPAPQGSIPAGSTPQNSGSTPKPPTRDYVNPNLNKAQGPRDPFPALKPASNPVTQVSTVAPTKAPTRDFVNPNFNSQKTPRDPFPALKPPRGQAVPVSGPSSTGTPTRDYVNPNAGQQRPRDPFPTLRTSPASQLPTTPKVGLSYAQKASGGVTTARPQASTMPSSNVVTSPGPLGGSTTVKPDDGPKDDELREFSEALLKKDVNNAFKYIKANVQGKTTSQSKDDQAPQKLLEVSKEAFEIPTIAKLRLLFNNYILEVTENEHVTPQEKTEENDLLDVLIPTPIMQHTRNFLISKGKVSKDPKDFKDLLRTIWFSMYSRGGGKVGSSGFEHIFVAELKKGEVSGLHNWLYFHEAEQTNLADYLGYMKKIDLGEKGAILKFHFTLKGNDKPVNSIFIGTSPELEMALYTTCYVFRANRICPLRLNGNNFIVRAYSLKYRGKYLIGSAFPEI